jgi:hypothetical protein
MLDEMVNSVLRFQISQIISGSQNSLTKYRSMLIGGETLLRAITLLMSAIS